LLSSAGSSRLLLYVCPFRDWLELLIWRRTSIQPAVAASPPQDLLDIRDSRSRSLVTPNHPTDPLERHRLLPGSSTLRKALSIPSDGPKQPRANIMTLRVHHRAARNTKHATSEKRRHIKCQQHAEYKCRIAERRIGNVCILGEKRVTFR
jgi:hypothetical protein